MAGGCPRPPGGGSDGERGRGEPAARLSCSLPLACSASLRAAYVSRLIGGRHVRSAVAAQAVSSGGGGERPRREAPSQSRARGAAGESRGAESRSSAELPASQARCGRGRDDEPVTRGPCR